MKSKKLKNKLVDRITISKEKFEFIKENKRKWDTGDRGTGYIIVDAGLRHPGYVMNAGIAGTRIADEFDLKTLFLTSGKDRGYKKVCESYGADTVVSPLTRYRPRLVARAANDAVKAFSRIDTPADLTSLSYCDIPVGDLVYNTYLGLEGRPTLSTISRDLVPYLFHTFLYYRFYDSLLERYDVQAVLASQESFARSGTLVRLGISKDINTYLRRYGPKEFTVGRAETMRDTWMVLPSLSESLFEYVWTNHREYAADRGQEIMANRYTPANADGSDAMRPGQIKRFDSLLTTDGPTVVIMSHVFSDAPQFGGSVYRDYYVWLEETIRLCQSISGVNWFVKPHPHTDRYDDDETAADVLRQVMSKTDGPDRVQLLPKWLNDRCTTTVADAVVTVRGTAGIEFPTLGVPALVASNCYYTGFGFTRDAGSISEYETLLRGVESIDPITDSEQKRASVMAYVLHDLIRVQCSVVPEMTRFQPNDEQSVWREAYDRLRATDSSDSLSTAFRNLCDQEDGERPNVTYKQLIDPDEPVAPTFK